MREILFRGKRIDNGEWVAGHFSSYSEVEGFISDCLYISADITLEAVNFHEVNNATVGQYTGLQDKNGKRIFEGDILRIAKKMDDLGGYYFPPLKYPANVVVKWDFCAWMWETLCEDKRYISFPEAWCKYECEIIGNIHDNPELLGGAE